LDCSLREVRAISSVNPKLDASYQNPGKPVMARGIFNLGNNRIV
jgi:hypothetical protein